jgi:SAM-dependent methyltransferase
LSSSHFSKFFETKISFHTLSEWSAWWAENCHVVGTEDFCRTLSDEIMSKGIIEPLTDRSFAGAELIRGTDLREGLLSDNINSRQRAVLKVVSETIDISNSQNMTIYAPEAVTAFALRMRGMFPRFLGSEFTLDPNLRRAMFPIQFEDLTNLSFADNSFDLICTNEVLEHVPSIDKALREVRRVLRPSGWHVGTQPLLFQEESIIKTTLEGGKIVNHLPPEYHGDPFGSEGSLVFEIPGWNLLRRAKEVGFKRAEFRLIISKKHGCVSSGGAGIYVLCLQK